MKDKETSIYMLAQIAMAKYGNRQVVVVSKRITALHLN